MKNIKSRKIIAAILACVLMVSAASGCSSNVIEGEATIDGNAAAADTVSYEEIFEKDKVIDIKVEIAKEDWESILDDPLAEEYKSANVTVDGITVENAGFRTKGNLTLSSVANSSSERYSFRIKLDKYVEGQSLLGLDEFVVNNMYSDASYMREYLSYEALEEIGADVPETVFANIYINDELYGFYICIEAIDDSFLERNFGSNDGNLYKQEQGSTLQYVENSNYDKSELKSGDEESRTDLKNFIKILNEMPEGEKGNIESVLDVDSALRYIASNTVLGNYDSYSGNMAQNYYLYGQNGKFTVIPWDLNMSFNGYGGGGDAATIPIDEPVMGINLENLPLIDNLLAVDEYKEKYHEYIKELLGYLEGFESRVTELANIIRPYVEADPSKFVTMEQFEASIKYSETNTTTDTEAEAGDAATAFDRDNIPAAPEEGFGKGERPEPPEGGFESGNMPASPQGGIGGMRMMGNSASIINFVRDRVENITKQLNGELPTTGNTTMNNTRNNPRGRNRPEI